MLRMKHTKDEIRVRLKAARLALSADWAAEANRVIAAKCIELVDWNKVHTMHSYVPVMKENEPDCWPLLEYAWQRYPHIRTAVPVKNVHGEYDAVVVNPQTSWQRAGVRIPRPIAGEVLPAHERFDVIIVPMLGFDTVGYRLGHGKGWYDRFLATQTNAIIIGMCYESGFVPAGLPHEAHDIPMQHVVTERRVLHI